MTTADQIAADMFPDLTEADRGYIIWNCTGFPSFFRDEDGDTLEECLRNQLEDYRDVPASCCSIFEDWALHDTSQRVADREGIHISTLRRRYKKLDSYMRERRLARRKP